MEPLIFGVRKGSVLIGGGDIVVHVRSPDFFWVESVHWRILWECGGRGFVPV